jgi:hypothetical protein
MYRVCLTLGRGGSLASPAGGDDADADADADAANRYR